MLKLRKLKWVAYTLPALGLVGLEAFRYFVLHAHLSHLWTSVVIVGVVVLGVLLFTYFMFRVLEDMEKRIMDQNRELADLHHHSERRSRRMTTLYQASVAMTAEVSGAAVLQKVADLSRALAPAQYAALVTLKANKEIEQFITSGICAEERARIGEPPKGLGLLGVPIKTAKPIRVDDLERWPDRVGFPPNHPPMRRFLGVPMLYKGTPVGELYLANTVEGPPFTQEDEEILSLFANQAAIAIENAHLYQRIQTLAVLEDRERIGRELHDSVIQSIYAVGLTLEGVHDSLEGTSAEARERLDYAIGKLNETIRDIRNYIFRLQPHVYTGKSLRSGLEDLMVELRVNSLLEAELRAEGDLGPGLSSDQTVEVLQIVREALTNVVKHARASHVTIDARSREGVLTLTVRDDGAGFDPHKLLGTERRGLRNMQQRAETLSGTLDIHSQPGAGTALTLTVPLSGVQERQEA